MLKKYIIYSKRFVKPKISEVDNEKLSQFYVDIRKHSNIHGGIPIAVRHIESVIRMSEAFAKIHLRDFVKAEDIDFAIKMMVTSFIQSQKESLRRVLNQKDKLGKYLIEDKDDYQGLRFALIRLAEKKMLLEKSYRNIDTSEKMTVKVTKAELMKEFPNSNERAVDGFLRSDLFKKEFGLDENNQIICTKVF